MKANCHLAIRRVQWAALIVFAALAVHQLHAQGTVQFQNNSASYVYDASSGIPVLAAGGTTFSVALYWAAVDPNNPTVQPPSSAFTAQSPTAHVGLFNPTTGQYFPGLYQGGTVTIAGITPPGGSAWFQVKAWETACGSTFELAYNRAGNSVFGVSRIINIRTGDPTTGGSPALLAGVGSIYLGPLGPPYGDPCVP